MKGSGRQASREPDHKHPAWETNEKKWETNEKKWEVGDKPAGNPTTSTQPGRQRRQMGSGRQASREPDHKHPAWETNEKNWETNERSGRQMKARGRQASRKPDHKTQPDK